MGPVWTTALLAVVGAIVLAGFGAFAVTSAAESERRATLVSLALSLVGVALLLVAFLASPTARFVVAVIVAVGVVVGIVLFLLPIGRVAAGPRVPQSRMDERDIMYARVELKPGTPAYDGYYSLRPERKAADDRMRSLPGLLSPDSLLADPLAFGAADVAFGVTMGLVGELEGEPAEEQTPVDRTEMTAYLKGLARYWGADMVGITEVRDYHLYSHRGMDQERFGEPIDGEYRFALSLAAELDPGMLTAAPQPPVIMESGRSYLAAGAAAVMLAGFIRSTGYPARAHIVDHYSMIAPLVARDAGLGEVGRHGVLITPELGSRVRLAFVTTDMPLEVDSWKTETSVLDFCDHCRKCAENCPPKAIPLGQRQMVDGALRWKIDPERCFHYWCSLGTDCARCVAVCPYSHPNGGMHAVVRAANRHSGAARRVTLWMDDLFYGRKRGPGSVPDWMRLRKATSTQVPLAQED